TRGAEQPSNLFTPHCRRPLSPPHLRSSMAHRTPLSGGRLLVALALALPGLALAAGSLHLPEAGASTVGSSNAVLGYGSASSTVADQTGLAGPVTGIASTPSGNGYWVTTASGAVQAEGDATSFGGMTGALNAPVIGIAATPDGGGYWLVGGDGGIFSFGNAPFYGSTGSLVLNK